MTTEPLQSAATPMLSYAERQGTAQKDYDYVRRSLEYVSRHWQSQPDLMAVAMHVGLSETHLTALFRRWAGLTPKAFLQAVTLDHARRLLQSSASVLETTLETGLSGPGRLHDLFVTHEALSPGEWKKGGAGLIFSYGFHPSPFGEALIVTSPRGLIAMGWVDERTTTPDPIFDNKHGIGRAGALQDMTRRWPAAQFKEDFSITQPYARRVFEPQQWLSGRPLRLVLIGSDFDIRVWTSLLQVPFGCATTYSDLARAIGNPKAARAVGTAVGRNPLSFVVPCHRVLGKTGTLTGYHWGIIRKQAILGWEAGQLGQ